MAKVVFDEAGDEEIAVVITGLHPQRQRIMRGFGGLKQGLGFELIDQKIVTITLINQGRQFFRGLGHQHTGVPLAPAGTVFTQEVVQYVQSVPRPLDSDAT